MSVYHIQSCRLQYSIEARISDANYSSMTLTTICQHISLGKFPAGNRRLITFAWDPSLGNFICDRSLGIFRLICFALELCLGIFAWLRSLNVVRLGIFAWDVYLGKLRLGSVSLGTFALELSLWNCSPTSTSVPLRVRSKFMRVPLRFHFEFSSVSLRFHFNVTSMSPRSDVAFSSISLRSHRAFA